LKWIQLRKISVPEELSLVTLDYDSNALSGRMKVNTILIPNRMINEAAVEELICKIEHKASGKKVFLPAIKDQGTVGIAPKNRNSKVWKTEKQPKK
jgi:DNA-binding LacI/PurR family transcriptional regulator